MNPTISLYSLPDTVRMVIIIPTDDELGKYLVVSAPTNLQRMEPRVTFPYHVNGSYGFQEKIPDFIIGDYKYIG